MKRFFFLNLIFISLFAEGNDWQYRVGGTGEILETRFIRENDNTKTNLFGEVNHKSKTKLFIEKRQERALGAIEYKNDFFYTSLGHRYKPIPGFYFLRDSEFYSGFQNPKTGIIPQPLNRSGFIGGHYQNFGAGIFLGKEIAEKKPGFYFHTPKEILGLGYSKETEVYFFALNLRDYKPSYQFPVKTTVSSQAYGKKENYFGYANIRWEVPNSGLEFAYSTYLSENGNVFAVTRDNLGNDGKVFGKYFKISRYFYDRIELFESIVEKKVERVYGGNSSLISGALGAICIGARLYEMSEKNQSSSVVAVSTSYEYKLRSTEFILRAETRKNQDSVLELKYTVRPIPEWRFEISSLTQKEGNEFRALYEQWSDGENMNTILTDRVFAYKLKVIGSFLVFNASGSRKREGSGEIYFANIQFKLDF
ncbi:MAG: hypothetical protein SFU98_03510 [Leptospiraceae bacterium]|nr:hypothetical protein [Leptospiraceae bacterium]